MVSPAGVATDPEKVRAVHDWPQPAAVTDVRSFLGLVSYYRRFIEGFAQIARPLHHITEKGRPFKWTTECQEAFEALKHRLISSPILAYPIQGKEFIIDTDASGFAIGAVLSQVQEDGEHVLAYGSRALTKQERNYCVTRKKLLAIVYFVKKYHHYLYGTRFRIRTDHRPLKWLYSVRDPQGQLARWLQKLSIYDFIIEHRSGRRHGNADAMSRKCFPDCDHTWQEEINQGAMVHVEDLRQPHMRHAGCSVVQATIRPVQDALPLAQAARPPGLVAPPEVRATQPPGTVASVPKPVLGAMIQSGTTAEAGGTGLVTDPVTMELSHDHVAELQRCDSDLKVVLQWVEYGQRPSWESVAPLGKEVKFWWSRFEQLVLKHGALYIRWEPSRPTDGARLRLLVPKELQPAVLKQYHDLKTGGHLGVAKTFAKLCKSNFYWSSMRQSARRWVQRCQQCQKRKPPARAKRAEMEHYQVGAPLERVAIDVLGPLPCTVRGNKYIIVVGDYFTKWTECYPVPDHTAKTVATKLVDEFVARFGVPLEVHSDQGREFESEVYTEMCSILGLRKTRTTPYHPRSDGMIERFNRTIEAMLSLWVNKSQTDWDEHLALLAMAYRSAEHETTRETPNTMMLGREVRMPVDLLVGSAPEPHTTPCEYAQNLQEKLRLAHQVAREASSKQMRAQKKHYDRDAKRVIYHRGDVVWLHSKARKKGICPKLSVSWTGPLCCGGKTVRCVVHDSTDPPLQLASSSRRQVENLCRVQCRGLWMQGV